MSFERYIKEIGRGTNGSHDLGTEDAHQLFGAMLDGGVPDLELGAILLALRVKTESVPELLGFARAAAERVHRLQMPAGAGEVRPVVIASYNGARRQPNLTPLVALLLQRMGLPVLVHGTLEGQGRVASAYIFRELGILPCATLGQAQAAMDNDRLAFVPTAVLAPGLANLLSLRSRLGVRNSGHTVAKLIDPFVGGGGNSLKLVSVTHPEVLLKLREYFIATGDTALLMRGTEGEPYANPRRRPKIEFFRDGAGQVLFEQEHTPADQLVQLEQNIDAKATAEYIRKVMGGTAHLPLPIVNLLACCLHGAGYTTDFNQAKAIVAVETRSVAAA
ncbi:MAG: DNA-binding protein YbiB [Betaproteobacteria bacterium]